MVWVSIFRPRNSICCDGFRTDFFRFMTKRRRWSRKINVSVFIKIPSYVFLIKKISSIYRQDISLHECSSASVELLVPLRVLKISLEKALIQNKPFPIKQKSQMAWTHAQWHWEIGIFQIYLAEKTIFPEKVFKFKQCKPSIFKCFYGINLLRAFQYDHRSVSIFFAIVILTSVLILI